jgi:hypothetical protein
MAIPTAVDRHPALEEETMLDYPDIHVSKLEERFRHASP